MIGIVTWFNVAKGYGEIQSESGQVLFFTYLELPKIQKFRSIERGTIVDFEKSDEIQFDLSVAKNVKHVKKVSKKHSAIVDQLRSALL